MFLYEPRSIIISIIPLPKSYTPTFLRHSAILLTCNRKNTCFHENIISPPQRKNQIPTSPRGRPFIFMKTGIKTKDKTKIFPNTNVLESPIKSVTLIILYQLS